MTRFGTRLFLVFVSVGLYAGRESLATVPLKEEIADAASSQGSAVAQDDEGPLVNIADLGRVRGYRTSSASGREILAFRGIPYAEPPVGSLRFQEPRTVKPWEGVIDATKEAPVCLQYDSFKQVVRGSEDCLKLNIYTHNTGSKGWPRPVMLWIHGGGFAGGSGNGETDFYGPEYLLERDVVLVTINYRLGPFGFISTEDAEAPGNYGLFDQSMALRWVKRNIRSFGGDPDLITIFGESAGGASVEFHMLSPYSKGLFQRAIAQSGSAFNFWAMYSDVGQYTRLLAQHLDCPIADSREILDCLRTKDGSAIVSYREKIQVLGPFPIGFGPRVDSESKSPFFPGNPRDLVAEHKFYSVPLMTGVTQNEGAIILETLLGREGEMMKKFNENPQKYMRYLLNMDLRKGSDAIIQKILERYVNLGRPLEEQPGQMDKMLSDATIFYGMETATDLFAKHSERPVYSYYFSYSHSSSLTHPYGVVYSSDDHRIGHGDELVMLFHQANTPMMTSETDKKVSKALLDLWTSFAANGTPKSDSLVSQWLPRDVNNTRYLSIEAKRQMMIHRDAPYAIRMPFWNQLSKPILQSVHVRDEL